MPRLIDLQPRSFVRNLEAGYLWENFFIAAISSLLAIRLFLHVTGYPQISGGDFHIAHMLWGGILMLGAIMLLLLFLDKEARQLASVLAGIGFGAFIDELGKFITSDNDYFFQPTIAFIYTTFIIIFLIIRFVERYVEVSEKDYAVNALEILKDVIVSDLDTSEKKRAELFLSKSDDTDILVKNLKQVLKEIDANQKQEKYLLNEIKLYISRQYTRIVQNRFFNRAIIVFFVLSSTLTFFQALSRFSSIESFFDFGTLASSLISGLLVILGTYFIRHDHRYLSFEVYKYAVLVNIFLTQFFAFYNEQLTAVVELFLSITIYIALRYSISQEELYHKPTGSVWHELVKAIRS